MSNERSMIGRTERQGRWFLLALLMALASALVPAVCNSGLPSTRLVGSAFDPTTSAVALRTRSQEILVAKAAIGEPDDEALPTLALLPVAPRAIAQGSRIHSIPAARATAAPRLAPRHLTSARPRAPPALFG